MPVSNRKIVDIIHRKTDDLVQLKAVTEQELFDGMMIVCVGLSGSYYFDDASVLAPDDVNIIQPTCRIGTHGRFKKSSPGITDHNSLSGLNVDPYLHLTTIEKEVIFEDMAPAAPDTLEAKTLTSALVLYNGKLPSGLNVSWYDDKSPGDTVDVAIATGFTINSPTPTTCFEKGDLGLLYFLFDSMNKAIADLGINFNELNRTGNQVIADYDTQGAGDIIVSGEVLFSGGKLKILSVGKYNSFRLWQKCNANIIISDLDLLISEGKAIFALRHTGSGFSQTSNDFVFRFDDDTSTMQLIAQPTVTHITSPSKYLSGLLFYKYGDQFRVQYTGSNCFKKTYHINKVSYYSMTGLLEKTVNPASVPVYTDDFVIDQTVSLDDANKASANAIIAATLQDPYGNIVSGNSITENRLVHTYSDGAAGQSDDLNEYFSDEYYRLSSDIAHAISGIAYNFDSFAGLIVNQWKSSESLITGDGNHAQCFIDSNVSALVYPNINFASYLPSGPNYSLVTGDVVYYRSFYSASPHSNMQISLGNISGGIGQFGISDINLAIKLPTQTAWCDCAKPYDPAQGVDHDGDGCLSGSISYAGGNATVPVTFGGKSTSSSGYRVYVKITLRNATRKPRSLRASDW